MAGIEIGTVCYKLSGRRAGKKVVIVGFDKASGMAIIEAEAKNPRKCNLKHLWTTDEIIKVAKKVDSVPKPVVKEKTKAKKAKPVKKVEKKKVIKKTKKGK